MDDNASSRARLKTVLRCLLDSEVRVYASGSDALGAVAIDRPDLVLLDYRMPGLNGFELVERLRYRGATGDIPVAMITSWQDPPVRSLALQAGALDGRPSSLDSAQLRDKVRNLLRLSSPGRSARSQAAPEAGSDATRIERLRSSYLECLDRIASVRNRTIGRHTLRMSELLGGDRAGDGYAAPVVSGPPGGRALARSREDRNSRCDPAEACFAGHRPDGIMRSHARIGYQLLKGLDDAILTMPSRIAPHHHERFDGTGYPSQLRGEAIPLEAMNVKVADVLDALCPARSYGLLAVSRGVRRH